LFFTNDPEDEVARLSAGARPVHLRAARGEFVGEGFQMTRKVPEGGAFCFRGGCASRLPVLKAGFVSGAHRFVFAKRGADQAAMTQILRDAFGLFGEGLSESFHADARTSAR